MYKKLLPFYNGLLFVGQKRIFENW